MRQKPVELNRLIEIAKIQSTEASNRIEGIITTNARLKQLVADKTTPKNRDEEEILGYRNVLNLVHENYDVIPVRSNYILQLHRDLLKYTNLNYGGQFKTTPNEIDMVLESGEKVVLFKPLEPYETPAAVDAICEEYQKALDKELVDELILIPCFLLDFLCIHPFNDGNGRMSRLLTLLLLYPDSISVSKKLLLIQKKHIMMHFKRQTEDGMKELAILNHLSNICSVSSFLVTRNLKQEYLLPMCLELRARHMMLLRRM